MKFIYFVIIVIGLFTGKLISQTTYENNNVVYFLEQFAKQNKFVDSNKHNIEDFFPDSNFLFTKIFPSKIFLSYELFSNEEIKNLNLIRLSFNLEEIQNHEVFIDNIKNKSSTLNTLYDAYNQMAFIDVKENDSELFIYYYFDKDTSTLETIKNLQHFVNTFHIYNT